MGGTEPMGGATAKRVFGGVLLSGLAFVAFGLLGGGAAYGLEVTSQDADVDNTGVAVANSGGNVAQGNSNEGDQTAVNAQGAASGGGVAANSGEASNKSTGSATIVTGNATATGNESSTGVSQGAASGGGGLQVTAQDADVDNAGVGIANTGLNAAVGNVNGDQTAVNGQLAIGVGGIAANQGSASNVSRGSATIVTGNATATGNKSLTDIDQGAGHFGPGLGIVVQDADVDNAGVGIANTGLNLAVGNVTGDQLAVNGQLALGLGGLAFNAGSATNVSSGDASIVTGSANATGNRSATSVHQGALAGGSWLLPTVVLQDIDVDNTGVGLANTGLNLAVGNVTGSQLAVNLQLALGLGGLGVDTGSASNVSQGTAAIGTGGGTAVGNSSSTITSQLAVATGLPAAGAAPGVWLWFLLSGLLVAARRR